MNREALVGPVRAMQIITISLALGMVIFAAVVAGLAVGPAGWQQPAGPLTMLALPLAAILLVLSWIVPRMIITAARRRIAAGTWVYPSKEGVMPDPLARLGQEGQLVVVYQTALIIGAALCEGPAFFALVAAFIERSAPGLVIAGICLLLMLARFPTLRRLEDWLDAQRRAIEADRMLRQ